MAPPVDPPRTGRQWKLVAVAAGAVVVVGLAAFLLLGRGGSSAEAVAAAINLRASDVPGFTVQASTHSAAGAQFDSKFKSCVGGWTGDHAGSVDVSSPTFASGSGLQAEQVQSDMTLQRSTAIVASDLAFIHSGRIQACLSRAFDGVAAPTSSGVVVAIKNVRIVPLAVPVQGTSGTFGMRVSMTMGALAFNVPVNLDVLGYAVGRDELGLISLAIGRTFSAPAEQQLSQLLVSRAVAQPH